MKYVINIILTIFIITSMFDKINAKSYIDETSNKSSVIIPSPKDFFGTKKIYITVDKKKKKSKVKKNKLRLIIEPGKYGIYKMGSAKRRASILLKAKSVVLITKDTTKSNNLYVNDYAYLVVVSPKAVVNSNSMILGFGKRLHKVKLGNDSLRIRVTAGKYYIYLNNKESSLKLNKNQVYYFVNRDDPKSHKVLGDKLYLDGNYSGAYAHYKAAFKIDSTDTTMFRRYAELAFLKGSSKDAENALNRVINAGLADEQTFCRLGNIKYKKKDFTNASEMFQKAINKNANSDNAFWGLGRTKLKLNDLSGAINACMNAIDINPDSAKYYLTLGNARLQIGDTSKAMDSYKLYIQKGGRSSKIAQKIGSFEFKKCKFEDAVKYLKLVKGKRSLYMDYLSMFGESYYNLGEFKKAYIPLRLAANKYPRSKNWRHVTELLIKSYIGLKDNRKAKYWVNKYVSRVKNIHSPDVAYYRAYLQEKNSLSKAFALYEKNIKSYPNDYRNYLRLGLLKLKNKKTLRESIIILKKAVVLADTVPEVWLGVAQAYRQANNRKEELSALKVFLSFNPQHIYANSRVGEIMMKMGKSREAVSQLEIAVSAGQNDPQILLALARGYIKSKRYTDAIKILDKAKKIAPREIDVYRTYFIVHKKLNDINKSIEDLKNIINLKRDNSTLLIYAKLLCKIGKLDEAVEAIEDIRATNPEDTHALMLLGQILKNQKKYAEAIDVYREISMINPSSSSALRGRADVHFVANQINWAKTFYNRALRADSRNALAILGLAKIAKVRGDLTTYKKLVFKAHRIAPKNSQIIREYNLIK